MKKSDDFASQNEKAKYESIKKIALIVKREGWNYEDWRYVVRRVRESLELRPEGKQRRKIPRLLTGDEMRRYMEAVVKAGNLTHEVMIRFLLTTGCRVSELVNIELRNVDLPACKVFLAKTKGDKPREVLFPEGFRPVLQAYIQGMKPKKFLFESERYGRFSVRRIQQIVGSYGEASGLTVKVHPHLFRHHLLTRLSSAMSDSAVRCLSGHKNQQSLSIYQHLATDDVAQKYQEAMKNS